MTMIEADLQDRLRALDSKGYKAYKALRGQYDFPDFKLCIDKVQGDPFASPSQIRAIVPQSVAQFPRTLHCNFSRRVALEDFLLRQIFQCARTLSTKQGSGNSGLLAIIPPSQAIVSRTAVQVSDQSVEVRFTAGLPAFGRRIAGAEAVTLLCDTLPQLVRQTLRYDQLDAEAIAWHCQIAEDADWLRGQLSHHNLVAFVANNATLPRQSGVDDGPLAGAVPFVAPASLTVNFTVPSGMHLSGMGIPHGITLIVGGGYHGKSTLLKALAAGIYNHIPGDGREYVVTDATAIKIRAEEGRSISGVNLSPFINYLPQGQPTHHFSTADASGSTSQAASLLEAIEAGATVFMMDEDTSATNFMIRDQRMQALIAKEREPITPFIDTARFLLDTYGISTILVMGGSGDYFEVADTVIAMDTYQPYDVTAQAHAVAATYPTQRRVEGTQHFGDFQSRKVQFHSIDASKGSRDRTIKVITKRAIQFGTETIDLSAVEQLIEPGQLHAIAAAILYAKQHYCDDQLPLATVLELVHGDIEASGLDCLTTDISSNMVAFRKLELAAALNRLRGLQVTR